ncbi:hypothetical protein BDR07DRAFT_1407948 [Suillus spraguei]|nr:hypothetical protein BDR07DRAFT_1407948 [Suillus spraguei]
MLHDHLVTTPVSLYTQWEYKFRGTTVIVFDDWPAAHGNYDSLGGTSLRLGG